MNQAVVLLLTLQNAVVEAALTGIAALTRARARGGADSSAL